LHPDQFDLGTGEPLPSLNEDFAVETEGIDEETIAAYGERLRLDHIETAAALQAQRLKAAQAEASYHGPSERGAPPRLKLVEPPPPERGPEPKRIPGEVAPVWSRSRGVWTPTYLYDAKGRAQYAEFLRAKAAEERKKQELQELNDAALPALAVDRARY
jgi:hypothetical protein